MSRRRAPTARRRGRRAAARGAALGLHALHRPGPRDHRRAARAHADRRRMRRPSGASSSASIARLFARAHPQCRDRDHELVGAGDRPRREPPARLARGRRPARRRRQRRAQRVRRAARPSGSTVPVFERSGLQPGARIAGPALDRRGRHVHLRRRPASMSRVDAGGALVLTRQAATRTEEPRSMSQADRRHRAADHVEPADRRGRGAGADAAAHGLLLHRARGGRPLGRHLRRQGPHAGAGRHRHAGPRQLHGGVGQALHPPLRARDHEARRRLHHQRSVDGHRPSQRLRHHHALLPQGQAGRPVLLHLASHGHRRHRLRARRHRRVHGRPLHPVAEARSRAARSTRR